MSQPDQYFHLTLGPVQGFVSQARRTRDFWAGSFLLSWLSSVAMASVQAQGGKIEFPVPDEDFLKAIQGKSTERLPKQGSVPNRFKALGATVDHDFNPDSVVQAIQQAWLALCQHIWKSDLSPYLEDERQLAVTREIWFRQVSHFWEINWCLTGEPQRSDLLDRRKNWRSHVAPDEPGVKCMMMSGWQELSGLERPAQEPLDTFWNGLRESLDCGNTDLRPGECLSALAFVKRRFVRHFEGWKTTLENGLELAGWKLNPNVPSVPYMAAAPWYAQVLEKAAEDSKVKDALMAFFDSAEWLVGSPESSTPLTNVSDATNRLGLGCEYSGLDGVVFHVSQLEQGGRRFDQPDNAGVVLKSLAALRKAANMGEASSFYAVVVMDGDSLGSQMSNTDKQSPISHGLKDFTDGVPEIVARHSGFLIYAGGDDVLALSSVDHAIDMASEIRAHYNACFAEQNKALASASQITTSLSAGIQFAHMRLPLTFVLEDAHRLLDDVAKEKTGRDSLAIRVWKPGGLHLEWSQPWGFLLEASGTTNRLSELQRRFVQREQASHFTNKFIFKAMTLLERLPKELFSTQADASSLPSDHLLRTLLVAEMRHSGISLDRNPETGREEVDSLIEPLLELLEQRKRQVEDGQPAEIQATGDYCPDALRLIRFLTMETQREAQGHAANHKEEWA
jgi:CRISPR-associated protein Cmr2